MLSKLYAKYKDYTNYRKNKIGNPPSKRLQLNTLDYKDCESSMYLYIQWCNLLYSNPNKPILRYSLTYESPKQM